MTFRRMLVAFALLLVVARISRAVITAPQSLGNYMGQTSLIFVAKVDKLFPEKPALVLEVTEDLKGKAPYRRMPIVVKLAPKEKNENYIPEIMKRLAPDLEVILFVMERDKKSTVLGFTNGTWFLITGQKVSEDRREWGLITGEPYLRRTFKGTTAEMKQLVVNVLAKKVEAPETNENEKPGFGPEIEKKTTKPAGESSSLRGKSQPRRLEDSPAGLDIYQGGGLFAVIPTVVVGAPLAILAALFPAIFGGVFTLFRQWLAFITIVSVNSTILLLVLWLGQPFRGSWWGSEAALWFVMTMITLVGVLWSWRRQIRNVFLPTGISEAPRRTENLVLVFTSVSCLLMVGVTFFMTPPNLSDLTWDFTLAFSLGIWFATAVRLVQTVVNPDSISATRSTEGMILGVVLLASVCIYAARWGGQIDTEGKAEVGPSVAGATGDARPEPPTKRWTYGIPSSGVVLSVPLIQEDKVFFAVAHPTPKWGTLICLERDTGKPLWEFTDEGSLQECYSSPVFADGKLYMGEGFHWSKNCKVYCIDAATGKKVWEHQTTSQTEATPAVVNDKVYIGAGNQGFLCLDAKTGQKLWQFDAMRLPNADGKQKKVLRFGSGPAVADGKVYFGTGVDRDFPRDQCDTRLFGVDADTGKLIWQQTVDLPCWGIPSFKGDLVYFSLGNGDVATDAADETPAGAVIALHADTGKKAWQFRVDKGIIEGPAVDHHNVYAGARDGHVYCLGRFDGVVRWKRAMASPVISSPALVRSTTCDQTASVIAVGANGKVCCLDPNNGEVQWTYDLTAQAPHIGPARVLVGHSPDGDRRQIFFGAALGGAGRLEGTPVIYCLEDLIKPR